MKLKTINPAKAVADLVLAASTTFDPIEMEATSGKEMREDGTPRTFELRMKIASTNAVMWFRLDELRFMKATRGMNQESKDLYNWVVQFLIENDYLPKESA